LPSQAEEKRCYEYSHKRQPLEGGKGVLFNFIVSFIKKQNKQKPQETPIRTTKTHLNLVLF